MSELNSMKIQCFCFELLCFCFELLHFCFGTRGFCFETSVSVSRHLFLFRNLSVLCQLFINVSNDFYPTQKRFQQLPHNYFKNVLITFQDSSLAMTLTLSKLFFFPVACCFAFLCALCRDPTPACAPRLSEMVPV